MPQGDVYSSPWDSQLANIQSAALAGQLQTSPQGQDIANRWANYASNFGYSPTPFMPASQAAPDLARFMQTMKSIGDNELANVPGNNINALPGYMRNYFAALQPLLTSPAAQFVGPQGTQEMLMNGWKMGALPSAMSPLMQAIASNLGSGNNPGSANTGTANIPATGSTPTNTAGAPPTQNITGDTTDINPNTGGVNLPPGTTYGPVQNTTGGNAPAAQTPNGNAPESNTINDANAPAGAPQTSSTFGTALTPENNSSMQQLASAVANLMGNPLMQALLPGAKEAAQGATDAQRILPTGTSSSINPNDVMNVIRTLMDHSPFGPIPFMPSANGVMR